MPDYVADLTDMVQTLLPKVNFQSPGLYLNQSEWDNLEDKLQDPFFADLHERNLLAIKHMRLEKNGDDICDVPVFLGADQLRYGEGQVWPSRVLKNIICRNVAAWYCTQERIYLDYAIEAMDDACDRDDEWFADAPFMGIRGADLATGDMTFALTFGLDALWNQLSEKQRLHYLDCLAEKGLGAYLKGVQEHDWWNDNYYNWNPSLHANASLAALVLKQYKPELADQVLRYAIPRMGLHLHKYLKGGGYSEGPMYQCTGTGHLSDFVIAWHKCTGNDFGLSQHQGFIDSLELWSYMIGGDGKILNVSNCDEDGIEYSLAQAAWWARHLNKPELLGYHHKMLRPWQDTHQLFYDVEFFWHQEANQPVAFPDVSGLKHFEEIDWLSYKVGDMWLWLCAGWNGGGHHNQDQGHIILGYGEERFLCDPGYGQSKNQQHNTITVGGPTCPGATCPIVKLEKLERGFYACVDLQPGFPYKAKYCKRHIIVSENQAVLIIDDAEGQSKAWSDDFAEKQFIDINWFWQTRQPVHVDEQAVFINGKNHKLHLQSLSDINCIDVKQWEYRGQIRTLSWRERYNRFRSIHPSSLSFTDEVFSWKPGENEHLFSYKNHSYQFVETDNAGLKFINS
jgi:hypothetical protein